MNVKMLIWCCSVIFFCAGGLKPLCAQIAGQDEIYVPEPYEKRIKKTHIDGVYIPKDIEDAMRELDKKVESSARASFAAYTEEEAASKSFFGFGRWLSVNWGMEEGSRISHYFKEQKLGSLEDQIRVLMVSYHRHINGKDLETEALIEHYRSLRRLEYEAYLERIRSQMKRDTVKKKQ